MWRELTLDRSSRPGAMAFSTELLIACCVFNRSSASLKKSSLHPCLHERVKAVDLSGESVEVAFELTSLLLFRKLSSK